MVFNVKKIKIGYFKAEELHGSNIKLKSMQPNHILNEFRIETKLIHIFGIRRMWFKWFRMHFIKY